MSKNTSSTPDFKLWKKHSSEERHIYVVPLSTTTFQAYGVLVKSGKLVFMVQGQIRKGLENFCRRIGATQETISFCFKDVQPKPTPIPGAESVEELMTSLPLDGPVPGDAPPDLKTPGYTDPGYTDPGYSEVPIGNLGAL